LFFPASAVTKTLDRVLADEFNWFFSDQQPIQHIVGRLAGLVGAGGARIVLVIDALDEVECRGFSQSLSEFAQRVADASRKIKLIVSCKSSEWRRFCYVRDEPSGLFLAMRSQQDSRFSQPEKRVSAADDRALCITGLSSSELDSALEKYAEFFSLSEAPQGQLRDHCRSPFWLRVVSDCSMNQRPCSS
jgi:hypothetical protein